MIEWSDNEQRAYDEGAEAGGRSGTGYEDNPYTYRDDGSEEDRLSCAWEEGWDYAAKRRREAEYQYGADEQR